MSDLISRQDAIEEVARRDTTDGTVKVYSGREVIDILKQLPSAQPSLDEWCTDCSEYDHERHCCPRWNRVIRSTLEDAQERKTGRCSMRLIKWQYCKDLNEINKAISEKDENWEGLKSAEQIISITYDTNHGCYVVFWEVEHEL